MRPKTNPLVGYINLFFNQLLVLIELWTNFHATTKVC